MFCLLALCKTKYHLLLFSLFLIFAGCEQAFEPLDRDHPYVFSIYGYLDATADTQWVRVTPVRDQLLPGPDDPVATVRLENLETGAAEVLRDSLFEFVYEVQAHNFWSTLRIEPERTYRITATDEKGKSSSAVVAIPRDFPIPVARMVGRSLFVEIEGVDDLAYVDVIYRVREDDRRFIVSVPFRRQVQERPDGYQVQIPPWTPHVITRTYPNYTSADPVQIQVAAAAPGWPALHELDDVAETLPDGISNIENGTGFLAGLVTKTIPFRACRDENREPVPCPTERPITEQ